MREVGVALVGLGRAGHQHAEAIADVEGVGVRCGVDVAAVAWRPKRSTLREALADRAVDIVAVCTPPGERDGIVLPALEAGKAVLLEKPVALGVQELDRYVSAARAVGSPLACMLQHRFLVPDGTLRHPWSGDAVATVEVHRPRPPGHYAGGWRADPRAAGGGVMHHIGVHYADLACLLLGEPERVHSLAETASGGEVEVRVAVAARFHRGATLTVHASATLPQRVQRLALYDRDSSLVIDDGCVRLGEGDPTPALSPRRLRARVYERVAASVRIAASLGRIDAATARNTTLLLAHCVRSPAVGVA